MKNICFLTSSFNKKNIFGLKLYKKNKIQLKFNKTNKTLNSKELKKIINLNTIGILSGNEILDEKSLKICKNLKVISRCGVGIDNIDTKYAKIKKIKIKNTPLIPSVATAELTVIAVGVLIKNLYENIKFLKEKKWHKIKGRNLIGKNVGVIGYGNVGYKVSKIFSILGCNLLINDIYFKNNKLKKTPLSILMRKSDIIVITCSLTPKTKNLINKNNLRFLKKNCILVNTSRGGIINEKDLFSFLKKNKYAKAFSDCFAAEPYSGKLLNLTNFYSTAHTGSYTKETRDEMEKSSSFNLFECVKKYI